MIRLIVCDVDGTLLPLHDEHICQANLEAIRAAQDAGIIVTLATGRFYPTVQARVKELGIHAPVIASSGADIRVDGKTVEAHVVDDGVVELAIQYATEHGLSRYLFCGQDTLCLPEEENEALFAKWMAGSGGMLPVRFAKDLDELLSLSRGRTTKILMWARNQAEHEKAMADYQTTLGKGAQIVSGEPLNVEITATGVSKALALGRVCAMLGIGLDEVMAIGDSGNDAAMLAAAGVGVAVADAMEEAKRAADATVASCADAGVAEAIWRFALERKAQPGGPAS